MTKYVYDFSEGNKDMKDLLGGKGANLAEMASLGLPVPPGFTISTEVCTHFHESGNRYPAGLEKGVRNAMAKVEQLVGKRFGDPGSRGAEEDHQLGSKQGAPAWYSLSGDADCKKSPACKRSRRAFAPLGTPRWTGSARGGRSKAPRTRSRAHLRPPTLRPSARSP